MLTRRLQHFLITVSFLIISMNLFPAQADARDEEWDIYGKVESFIWKEFDASDKQLLKESGTILGVGFINESYIKGLTFKGKAELFGGTVNYDGQTQAGTPAQTDTNYFGLKVVIDIGGNLVVSEKLSIEPFAGFGYRSWIRDIESKGDVYGIKEDWTSFYIPMGIRGVYTYPKHLRTFVESGLKLPLKNSNRVDLGSIGGPAVTLEPGNEISVFAEVGLKWKILKASIFYEGMRFSKSDTVTISYWDFSTLTKYTFQFWQPESMADMFGMNVGIVF